MTRKPKRTVIKLAQPSHHWTDLPHVDEILRDAVTAELVTVTAVTSDSVTVVDHNGTERDPHEWPTCRYDRQYHLAAGQRGPRR